MCSIHCQHHNIGKIQFEYSQSFPSLMVWPRKTREWGKKGSKRGLAEWSVTTRLEPAPLTGWINAAAAFLAQVAFSPLSLAPPHLFQPRNSDIEQTAVGQSSQTEILTTQLLRSCNKAITSTHVPIIHTR